MMHLSTNVLGSFVLRDGKVVKQRLFTSPAGDIASKLMAASESYCSEEKELLRELADTGNERVYVNHPRRFRGAGVDIELVEEESRVPVQKVAAELGIPAGKAESLMREVNRLITRERMKDVGRDQILVQAVNSLDDIEEAVNRLVERLREWYSLHFPELDDIVSSHEMYARLVVDIGSRDSYVSADLNVDPEFTKRIVDASKDSLGVDFTEDDLRAVKALADPVTTLHAKRGEIEAYVSKLMEEIAPNLNALAGPLLGARLIALAGSLQRLSMMPAGTIQILGAEDAFFRFMKSGKKPPKHGVIFQYPDIRGSKKNIRGKLARTFAAKLAIAARVDAFEGDFIADKLKEDFEKRVKELTG